MNASKITEPKYNPLFANTYREILREMVKTRPQDYNFTLAQVDQVADRMAAAFEAGHFNKDGKAIEATCKKFGIRHTYSAIHKFMWYPVDQTPHGKIHV